MQTGRREQPARMCVRERERRARAGCARAGDDHLRDTGAVRALDDGRPVGIVAVMREIDADVDQLHARKLIVSWHTTGMPETNPPATQPSALSGVGERVLFTVVFAVAFWILCWALAVTAVVQLLLRLLSGKPHADLARFGAALGRYARQVIEYLTFASDEAPFPFRDWPAS